jgi:hypothetical protein
MELGRGRVDQPTDLSVLGVRLNVVIDPRQSGEIKLGYLP